MPQSNTISLGVSVVGGGMRPHSVQPAAVRRGIGRAPQASKPALPDNVRPVRSLIRLAQSELGRFAGARREMREGPTRDRCVAASYSRWSSLHTAAGRFVSIQAGEFRGLNLLCYVFQVRRESVRDLGRISSRLRDVVAHLEEAREHRQYWDQHLQLRHERRDDWQNVGSELHEHFQLLVNVRKLGEIQIRWKSERTDPALLNRLVDLLTGRVLFDQSVDLVLDRLQLRQIEKIQLWHMGGDDIRHWSCSC